VNRVWQQVFGQGLVTTPEDFGVRCQPPSHPELLDWLAVDFMEPGGGATAADSLPTGGNPALRAWSLKRLLRLIVTSRTYRQSSHITPALLEKDAENRLLARGPRFRTDGEIVRDIALAASGLLNDRIGGPSVMTPAPVELFKPPASYSPFPWVNVEGPDKYRRALYTFRRRSTPYPALQTFDVPNGDQSCVRRTRSNTPLQALTTLNEEIFVDCARHLARRMIEAGGGTTEERIRWAFRRVLGRDPSDDEVNQLIVLGARQRARLVRKEIDATEVATGKTDTAPESRSAAANPDLALATVIARVLLNLDETITKE
jgi:hypothetical protein